MLFELNIYSGGMRYEGISECRAEPSFCRGHMCEYYLPFISCLIPGLTLSPRIIIGSALREALTA